MPYTTRFDSELTIIEVRFLGVLTPIELTNSMQELMSLVAKHHTYKVFADCSQLTGGHSIIDLYDKAEALESTGMGFLLREAILLPKLTEVIENVKFWETACQNRGLTVRSFQNRQEAIEWLLERVRITT